VLPSGLPRLTIEMKGKWHLRLVREYDQDFLWDALYIALWDSPEDERRPRRVLKNPVIRRYVEGWGRPQDFGLVAVDENDSRLGAIWARLDGHEESEGHGCNYPCLGIAVLDQFHGLGIGSGLMERFIADLRGQELGLRLGVNPKNTRAITLYEKFGFREYAIGSGGYLQMKLSF